METYVPTFTRAQIVVAYAVAIVILLWIIISRWLRQRQYLTCVVSMAVFIAVICWLLISVANVPVDVEESVAPNTDSKPSSAFFRFQHALMSVDNDFHRLVLGDFQCHSMFQACQPFDGKQLMKFMDAIGR